MLRWKDKPTLELNQGRLAASCDEEQRPAFPFCTGASVPMSKSERMLRKDDSASSCSCSAIPPTHVCARLGGIDCCRCTKAVMVVALYGSLHFFAHARTHERTHAHTHTHTHGNKNEHAGLPLVLNATSLETLGEFDLGGCLRGKHFLAHTRYDSDRHLLVGLAVSQGGSDTVLLSLTGSLDRSLEQPAHTTRITHTTSTHDWCLGLTRACPQD